MVGMLPSAALPQVVAHRGASFENAEHTLGAYVKALDAGAEGLECDVRLTADGHLVCVHDRDLRRTASQARAGLDLQPRGPRGARLRVVEEPVGRARRRGAASRTARLDGVLTLRKLLETVADYDRRVEVAIETKHPTRYGGLVERRVAEMLHDFGWDESSGGEPSPARVMSFSHTALQRMERLAPGGAAGAADRQAAALADAAPGDGRGLGGRSRASTCSREHPRLAERIAASGHDVHVWTVNTEPALASLPGVSACRRSSPTARPTCWSCSTSSGTNVRRHGEEVAHQGP